MPAWLLLNIHKKLSAQTTDKYKSISNIDIMLKMAIWLFNIHYAIYHNGLIVYKKNIDIKDFVCLLVFFKINNYMYVYVLHRFQKF